MPALLALTLMFAVLIGAIYYAVGTVLVVVGVQVGGGRIWVQFGAWLVAGVSLVALAAALLSAA